MLVEQVTFFVRSFFTCILKAELLRIFIWLILLYKCVSSEIKCPFKTRTRVQMDSFGVCHYFSAENASPAKDNASKPSPRGRGRPKGTAMVSDVNRNRERLW